MVPPRMSHLSTGSGPILQEQIRRMVNLLAALIERLKYLPVIMLLQHPSVSIRMRRWGLPWMQQTSTLFTCSSVCQVS